MNMSKKSLLKVCAVFAALFVAAAQLPVMAAEPAYSSQVDEEEVMRCVYASNITLMLVKAAQFNGNKPITPEQVTKIYGIAYEEFPKVLARVKEAGFYDEYKRQIFDAKIRREDSMSVCAQTVEEIKKPAAEQMSYLQTKYPRLWKWMNTDAEARRIVMRMFQKIQAVLE